MISCKNHLLYINKINVTITDNEQENPVKNLKNISVIFNAHQLLLLFLKLNKHNTFNIIYFNKFVF